MTDKTVNQATLDEEPLLAEFPVDQWMKDIVTQTEQDKTVPFMPVNLLALVNLKITNRAQFEFLREKLNGLGVQLGRFDDAVKQQEKALKENAGEAKKKATDLILESLEDATYFHSADETAFADIIAGGGHRETWSLQSRGFERWMLHKCHTRFQSIPTQDSLKSIISTLMARAILEGEERAVFVRTATVDEKIYIDLCNDRWQVVEIDSNGYRIADSPPVRFRRKSGMKPLPAPERGGNIEQLRDFLNVKDDNGFILVVAWLLMALRGHGPYPVLAVVGEQGTAKSTLMSFLRQLVDPNTAALRTLPREARDLFISANNSLVLAFDNLSYMSDWTSDALCRLSTGGGFATRTLRTDDDEVLFDAMRPILMNGIENVGTRGDLVDRSIILRLEPISESQRKPAKQLQAEFDEAFPFIFGALLEMLSHGLERLPYITLDQQPRMADFALWATACETAAWPEGTFMEAFEANRAEANEDVIAASPLASAICDFLHQSRQEWSGTATDLLAELRNIVSDEITKDPRLWPRTHRILSERLSRVAPALRRIGIGIERYNGKNHKRIIKLFRTPEGLNTAPPPPSTPGLNTGPNKGGSPKTKTNDYKKKTPKFAKEWTKK